MSEANPFFSNIIKHFESSLLRAFVDRDELSLVAKPSHLLGIAAVLKKTFAFEQLMDVCGVDYKDYGISDWQTEPTGFSRGVQKGIEPSNTVFPARFAVVYHLLSLEKNQRLRLMIYLDDQETLPSVCELWPSANWFERETFDLFGIQFTDHPDLRRILTDYGFVGYPFRKDFPLSGHVEMRYDGKLERVIYEPVDIKPRTLVPKVIRQDSRYRPVSKESRHD